MGRQGDQLYVRKIAHTVGVVLLLSLAACEPFWTAPEGRAQNFIKSLVITPMDTQKQRTIANLATDQNPELLLDMSAQVALGFLRAKQTQGIAMSYNQSEFRHSDAARRAVMISVTYPQSGTSQYGEVRLRAQLERDSHGAWHIVRVTGDK